MSIVGLVREYADAAEDVFAGNRTGIAPLEALGWSPAMNRKDPDEAAIFAALFLAHGRQLGETPALGALVANELSRGSTPGYADLEWTASCQLLKSDDDSITIVGTTGMMDSSTVVIDLPDGNICISPTVCLELVDNFGALDPSVAMAAVVRRHDLETVQSGLAAAHAHETAIALARLGIAWEILGTCEHVLTSAVEYTKLRVQFGKPIASFQAVQHLLAEAHLELTALRSSAEEALNLLVLDDDWHLAATLVKAIAGRTARQVMSKTLLAFGAIAFSWEHDHHRYQRRALTLDAIYGSGSELRDDVGLRVIRTGHVELPTCIG